MTRPADRPMERLWAPWRMDYILSDEKDGCFICRALEEDRDRENLLVWREEHALCICNRYPYNNGHLLIAPLRHISDVTELSEAELHAIMRLTQTAVQALRRLMHPDGFNIGMNLGKCAGAGLEEHVHQHIVPRWVGDTNFMPILSSTKIIPQALADFYDTFKPVFEDILKER